MKLSTAINKASEVYVVLATAGMSIPIPISKAKAKDAMSQWLDREDFEGDGEFTDEEDFSVAWYDYEYGRIDLGN